ncbi:hypothetical protein [Cohnella hongkongensis]|uniref:Uncharacterized protein n=1 Tax=Cohnella hongkongensis TaxID=178337 RepID=A0ABV9F8L1_9BACL
MRSLLQALSDRLPGTTVIVNALLAGIVPWVVYRINRTFRRYGDPPWKREEDD